MSSWFTGAFGYGLGAAFGRAIFQEEPRAKQAPIRQQTEEEILAAEKQYDADEKQLDANDAAARAARERSAS